MTEREQHPPATVAHPAAGRRHRPRRSPAAETPAPATRRGAREAPGPGRLLILLVAGIAAGVSLLLPWLADDDVTGLTSSGRGPGDGSARWSAPATCSR